jgi:hypothetical protein
LLILKGNDLFKNEDSFLIFKTALSIEEQKWTLGTFLKQSEEEIREKWAAIQKWICRKDFRCNPSLEAATRTSIEELLLGLCSLAVLSVSSLSLVSISGGLFRVPAEFRGSTLSSHWLTYSAKRTLTGCLVLHEI